MARQRNPPKTALAARLTEARDMTGLNRRKFADKIGISEHGLGNYERGSRTPKANIVENYARVCNISLQWLITGEGEKFDRVKRLQTESEINAAHLEQAMQIVEQAPANIQLTAAKKTELIKLIAVMLRNEQDIEPIKRVIAILS